MRLNRRWLSIVGSLQAAATVTVVFSLATLADQLHRYLELFAHFRLQYLVVACLLSVIFLALRNRAWAGLMLVTTAINALPVSMWYLAGTKQPTTISASITVLQANVYSDNSNTEALLELIAAEQPDFVFLQEVNEDWVTAMAALKGSYPHGYAIPRNDNFGIAIYAREPLLGVDTIESPPRGLPSLVARQSIGGQTVTFVTTHPVPPLGAAWFEDRNMQLASIADVIVSIPGPKALVGDLNTTMWAHHYGILVDATGLVNARYGFGVIPTWPRNLPFASIPIDHCLVSDEFVVLDVRAGADIGSDHRPLIVKLALK